MDNQKLPLASPGYETTDVNAGGIVNFLVILVVILVATVLICWGMFRYFETHQEGAVADSPFIDARQLPQGPQLQVNPREDLLQFREEQQQTLETYGWVNQSAGIVRVPIERAMELLLQKGLPVQVAGSALAPATTKPAVKADQKQ